MDYEVVPRPCKICGWLSNSSRDYFNLHQGKHVRVTMELISHNIVMGRNNLMCMYDKKSFCIDKVIEAWCRGKRGGGAKLTNSFLGTTIHELFCFVFAFVLLGVGVRGKGSRKRDDFDIATSVNYGIASFSSWSKSMCIMRILIWRYKSLMEATTMWEIGGGSYYIINPPPPMWV